MLIMLIYFGKTKHIKYVIIKDQKLKKWLKSKHFEDLMEKL